MNKHNKSKKSVKKQRKSNKGVVLVSLVIIIVLIGVIYVYLIPESDNATTNNDQPIVIGENLLIDPGFEDVTSLASGHWGIAGYTTSAITPIIFDENLFGFKIENNTLVYHNQIKYNGSNSAYIQGIDVFEDTVISNWNQKINDTNKIPYGKDIILSCWIKTVEAEDVIMMIQCWDTEDFSVDDLITYQSSKSYGNINGTIIWEKFSIKLVNVPIDTKVITIRLGLIGTGEVWFDDVNLYTVN